MQNQGTVLKSLRDEWGPSHMMIGYPVDNREASAKLAAQADRLSLGALDNHAGKTCDKPSGVVIYHPETNHG